MALGWKTIIEGVNPEVVAEIGGDVVIIRHNAAPTNGATGTGAGTAGPGSLLVVADGALYRNTGTLSSPVWSLVPYQAAAQEDSIATDVAGIVTDFNALLAKLRASGVLAT